jgi:hypothetical protein
VGGVFWPLLCFGVTGWGAEPIPTPANGRPTAFAAACALQGKESQDPLSTLIPTLRGIGQLTTDIHVREGGELPKDFAAEVAKNSLAPMRQPWAPVCYYWEASGLWFHPLYFEQINAERYGYTAGCALEPVISGAVFYLTIPTLPWQMMAQPPWEREYALGYYRPGSPAPRCINYAPLWPVVRVAEGPF